MIKTKPRSINDDSWRNPSIATSLTNVICSIYKIAHKLMFTWRRRLVQSLSIMQDYASNWTYSKLIKLKKWYSRGIALRQGPDHKRFVSILPPEEMRTEPSTEHTSQDDGPSRSPTPIGEDQDQFWWYRKPDFFESSRSGRSQVAKDTSCQSVSPPVHIELFGHGEMVACLHTRSLLSLFCMNPITMVSCMNVIIWLLL